MDLVQLNIKARGISVETCISDDAGRFAIMLMYCKSRNFCTHEILVIFVQIPGCTKII